VEEIREELGRGNIRIDISKRIIIQRHHSEISILRQCYRTKISEKALNLSHLR
jgi:hypothetical protein